MPSYDKPQRPKLPKIPSLRLRRGSDEEGEDRDEDLSLAEAKQRVRGGSRLAPPSLKELNTSFSLDESAPPSPSPRPGSSMSRRSGSASPFPFSRSSAPSPMIPDFTYSNSITAPVSISLQRARSSTVGEASSSRRSGFYPKTSMSPPVSKNPWRDLPSFMPLHAPPGPVRLSLPLSPPPSDPLPPPPRTSISPPHRRTSSLSQTHSGRLSSASPPSFIPPVPVPKLKAKSKHQSLEPAKKPRLPPTPPSTSQEHEPSDDDDTALGHLESQIDHLLNDLDRMHLRLRGLRSLASGADGPGASKPRSATLPSRTRGHIRKPSLPFIEPLAKI